MKTVYLIKELCPMWNDGTGVDYKVIKPYIFAKQEEAEECRLDYEYISADRVLCTEYELIEINLNKDYESINDWKAIFIEGELIKIRNVIDGDYEEEFRYDIHSWKQLELAGRIGFGDDNEESSDIENFEDWMEHDYLYSGAEFY